MKIIAGCSSVDLTRSLCGILNVQPINPIYKRFPDGEISVSITPDYIRGDTCLLMHSLPAPVNDNVVTLLLTIDALKQSGAQEITICIPYLAYMRQKHTVSFITSLMHAAGAQGCVTIDPHSHIEGAIPIDVLSTTQLFADHIKASHNLDDLVIVAPDQGGIERCRQVRGALGLKTDLASISKIRTDGICTVQAIYGDVRGKRCIIVDDIIDTGTTLCSTAEALMQHGALDIFAYCTHGVLSGSALELMQLSPIKKLVITDTIAPQQDVLNSPKAEIISISGFLAKYLKQSQMSTNHSF